MSKPLQCLIIMLVITAIVLIYNLYQIWFKPDEYIDRLTFGTKPWLPYYGKPFFYKWYTSKTFLWSTRIIYTIMLLGIITLLSLMSLGVMGLFP